MHIRLCKNFLFVYFDVDYNYCYDWYLKITWKYFLQQNLIQTTNKEKSSCLINVHSVQCCSFLWLIIYWSCLDVLYECRLSNTLLYNITYHIKSFYYYASFLHLLQVFSDIRFYIRIWIISVLHLNKMILDGHWNSI